jgi:hypothetical protein
MALLSPAHRDVLEALHDNAQLHAESSDGFFTVDPLEFGEIGPHLTLYTHRRDTSNRRALAEHRGPEQLESTAKLVDKRYASLPSPDSVGDRVGLALDNMATEVKAENDIVLALKHGETRDIAFNLGYISIGLARREAPHRTGLILSKGIDFLRIDTKVFGFEEEAVDEFLEGIGLQAREDRTVSVRDFIGVAVDFTYFVLPSSQTFRKLRHRHSTIIRNFNESTIKLIENDFKATKNGAYPLLLGTAATGTLEKYLDVKRYSEGASIDGTFSTSPRMEDIDPETVKVIGEISHGLLKTIGKRRTYASGILLEDENSSIDINPRYLFPTDEADLSILGNLIISVCEHLDPEHRYIQDLRGNLPVVRS